MPRTITVQKIEILLYVLCLLGILTACNTKEPFTKEPVVVPSEAPAPVVTSTTTAVVTRSGARTIVVRSSWRHGAS